MKPNNNNKPAVPAQQSVSSFSKKQCQSNCDTRRSNCQTFSSGNPSAPNAFKLQQIHTEHQKCSNFCNKLKNKSFTLTNRYEYAYSYLLVRKRVS